MVGLKKIDFLTIIKLNINGGQFYKKTKKFDYFKKIKNYSVL